jgi:hypothetical protein
MSFIPNSAVSGVGGMFEYQNAVSMGIDQINTYHPFWTSGVVAGVLDGWTFQAGLDGTFTSVVNAGGGQITFNTPTPHGMVAGMIVAITGASVAGYQPPNPTIFVVQSVTPTSFNVVATFTTTATGFWTKGAALIAGQQAAGNYTVEWSVTARASTGSNKDYRFEPLQNTTSIDKGAAGQLMNSTGPQACGGSAFVTVVAGDAFLMLCNNTTDVTDITIVDMNYRLKRYLR